MKSTKRTPEQQYWIPVATSEEKGQKCLVLSNSATSEEYSVSISKILLCFLLREKLRNVESCQGFECSPLATAYWERLSQNGSIQLADLITDPNFEILYEPDVSYPETFRFALTSISNTTLHLGLYDLVSAITFLSLYKRIPDPYFQAGYDKSELWEHFSYFEPKFSDRLCDIFIFGKKQNKPAGQDKTYREFVVNDSLKIGVENSKLKPLKLKKVGSGTLTSADVELSEIFAAVALLQAIKEGGEINNYSYLPEISNAWWNKLSRKKLLTSEGVSIPQIGVLSHENCEAPEEIKIATRQGEIINLTTYQLLTILFCLQLCGIVDEPKVNTSNRGNYWREVFRLFPALKVNLLRQKFSYLTI